MAAAACRDNYGLGDQGLTSDGLDVQLAATVATFPGASFCSRVARLWNFAARAPDKIFFLPVIIVLARLWRRLNYGREKHLPKSEPNVKT